MQKRISKRALDMNQLAAQFAKAATEGTSKEERSLISQIMSEMGRKGGRIGGKRSLVKMSPEQRTQRALNAARARWSNEKNKE